VKGQQNRQLKHSEIVAIRLTCIFLNKINDRNSSCSWCIVLTCKSWIVYQIVHVFLKKKPLDFYCQKSNQPWN
jgi:hypothetical protein